MANAEENPKSSTDVPPPPPPPPPRQPPPNEPPSIVQNLPANASSSTMQQPLPSALPPAAAAAATEQPMHESPPRHPPHGAEPSAAASPTKSESLSPPQHQPDRDASALTLPATNGRLSTSSAHQMPVTPPLPPVPYPPPPPPMMPPTPPHYHHPSDHYYHFPFHPPFPHTYPITAAGFHTTTYNDNLPPHMRRSWSTGLFDCFSDLKNSFITTFCPCFTFGQITEIINEGQTPWWEGTLIYLMMCLSTVSSLTFLYAGYYRAKMRKKYMLNGDWFTDFVFASFCHPCALCQAYRQLHRLGFDVALGWQESKERERRRAMEAMYQVPPVVEAGMFR